MRRGGLRLDRVHEERRTSFGSCSVGEEDFVWIVFSRRGGLLWIPDIRMVFGSATGLLPRGVFPCSSIIDV